MDFFSFFSQLCAETDEKGKLNSGKLILPSVPLQLKQKLTVAVVQAGHGVELSCHRQQSADQSADHLLPIQLAKLVKGALF